VRENGPDFLVAGRVREVFAPSLYHWSEGE
jgi:hypothetical protein